MIREDQEQNPGDPQHSEQWQRRTKTPDLSPVSLHTWSHSEAKWFTASKYPDMDACSVMPVI